MCGISGIYNFSDTGISEDICISMRDSMIHRGPDDKGIWISEDRKCSLAHRRLSIIDLSENAKQPMTNEDGKIAITYNGEIYNYLELRKYLERKGHLFKSNSDTESLLHLYEEKGFKLLDEIDGMFSYCIYDSDKELLFLARDPGGEKPLYYTVVDGVFIFASEIKALFKFPHLKREINLTALPLYLNFLVTPAPQTLFKNIYKLPNGYYLTVDKNGNLKQERYYDFIRNKNFSMDNFTHAENNVDALLKKSIKNRMMSDVPYGVFLSGGVDSSTNVALMSLFTDKPINTFSVSIQEDNISNENIYARLIAEKFKTNHHEVCINTNDFFSLFETLAYYQDEPIADPVCIPLFYVAKLANDSGVKVIQLGEGSDEIFAGYGHYQNNLRKERLFHLYNTMVPNLIKKTIYKSSNKFTNKTAIQDVLLRTTYNNGFFNMGSSITFYDKHFENLLINNEFNIKGYNYLLELFREKGSKKFVYNGFNINDVLFRFIYQELVFRIPELLLMRVDKMLMANSIEGRAPYLQKELVSYAISLPLQYKIKNGEGKYILKTIMKNILPEEILRRKKVGFCGSAANMLNTEIRNYAYNILITEEIIKEWINTEEIKKLFQHQQDGQTGNSLRIWALLNLALWVKQWL